MKPPSWVYNLKFYQMLLQVEVYFSIILIHSRLGCYPTPVKRKSITKSPALYLFTKKSMARWSVALQLPRFALWIPNVLSRKSRKGSTVYATDGSSWKFGLKLFRFVILNTFQSSLICLNHLCPFSVLVLPYSFSLPE